MPTGYTHGVQAGNITTFADYADKAAEAFIRVQLSEYKPSLTSSNSDLKYHKKGHKLALKELEKFNNMNLEKRQKFFKVEKENEIKRTEASLKECYEGVDRYNKFLKWSEDFEAPTSKHVKFKEFLISQLTESISFDKVSDFQLDDLKRKKELTFESWQSTKLRSLNRDIEYHAKNLDKSVEASESHDEWVEQLRTAIADYQPEGE